MPGSLLLRAHDTLQFRHRTVDDSNLQDRTCQLEDWESHKSRCTAKGLVLKAESGPLAFSHFDIPHSYWLKGEVSPISVLVGFPLRLIPMEVLAESPIVVKSEVGHPNHDGPGDGVSIIEVCVERIKTHTQN